METSNHMIQRYRMALFLFPHEETGVSKKWINFNGESLEALLKLFLNKFFFSETREEEREIPKGIQSKEFDSRYSV